MTHTTFPFARKLLLTVLLATFASQALAATYTYRKYIPGLKEALSTLAARTVPFIDHILPAGGDTAGGNTIAIYATPDGLNPLNGHGFAPGTTVSVDGALVGSTLQGVVSPGMGASLSVLMPFHAVGTAQVVVTDPRGTTVSAPYAYTHNVTVSAVTPASALAAGTSLTIYGTGFVSGSSVSIDGVPAPLTAAYSTQLVATAPSHAPGSATLTVTNPDTSHFTFSGLNYGAPATASFSSTSLSVGAVTVGQSAQTPTATVSNTGDFPLNYTSLSALPSGWSWASGAGACTLAGGYIPAHGACTLAFTFAPTSVAQGGGPAVFTPTNAGVGATTISLGGTAVVPAGPILPPVGSVFATWSTGDKNSSVVLSNNNQTAGSSSIFSGGSVRATQSKSSGKWYWEITQNTPNPFGAPGVATSLFPLNTYLGGAANSVGNSNGTAYVYWNGGSQVVPLTGGGNLVGDTLMVALDLDNQAIYYGKNGTWLNSGVPTSGAAKSGAIATVGGTVFPAIYMGGGFYSGFMASTTVNFGATTLKYTAPTGYHAGVYQ